MSLDRLVGKASSGNWGSLDSFLLSFSGVRPPRDTIRGGLILLVVVSIPRLWILGKVAQKLLPTGEFFFLIGRLNLNDPSHAILGLPCWNPEHRLLCHPTVVINLTSQLQQCFLLNLWKTRWKCLCSRSNLLVLDKEDENNCTLFFAIMCDKLRQCQNIVAFAREIQVL